MATHAGPEEHSDTHRLTSAEFEALFKQLRDATARGPEDRRGTLRQRNPDYDHSAQVYGAVPHLLAPTDLPR